jgi:hypothetical protein
MRVTGDFKAEVNGKWKRRDLPTMGISWDVLACGTYIFKILRQ